MASFNQIVVLGHVGKEPEFQFTSTGKPICKLSIAVNDSYGDKKKTTWFQIVFWEKLAETVEKYVSSGMPLLISGRMTCDEFKDKEGNTRKSWYITASSMQMLGEKKENKQSASSFNPLDDEGEFNPF